MSNRDFYHRERIVRHYARQAELQPTERAIFDKHADHIEGKEVLDLGCGGGRTTGYLSSLAGRYVGLDYSERMVAVCREKFPALTFIEGDASDLRDIEDESFDFVLFSFNGIDCMQHLKRLACLREIYRVLRPGGVYAFSSHNRDDANIVVAFDRKHLLGPKAIAKNVRNLLSYLKNRGRQEHGETYDILNDPLAGFGHMTYYIRAADQKRQLEEVGFTDCEAFRADGAALAEGEIDRESHWLYYTGIKPARAAASAAQSKRPAE